MKKILALFLLASCYLSSTAQVGINMSYGPNIFSNVDVDVRDLEVFDSEGSELQIGLDYWFRHKKKRIEFHPEIYYATSSSNDVKVEAYGFRFQTNVYPFDFPEDCDCPTFGKQNDFFQAGFFLSLAPGIRYQSWEHDYNSTSYLIDDKMTIPTLSIGAGLDIGISNLITITPVLQYELSSKFEYKTIGDFSPVKTREIKNNRLLYGVRLGLRFDKKNYNLKYKRKYKGKRRYKRKKIINHRNT